MDIIHLLPDTVANQIAAGEVIQRPASVIKELVENAVDAGASVIQIYITDAGKSCIQVTDNGKGMSATDARLAFERHSTSKISQASDLFSLQTMGFRGEALASIAAVAQVELKTRTAEESIGHQVNIEGGIFKSEQPISTPVGASFSISNLFFNIPARRRFLKSDNAEMAAIMSEVERMTMSHTDVSFKLFRDGMQLLDLPAGTFLQRIQGLFGTKFSKSLIPVEVDTDLIKIKGFVSQPDGAKKKSPRQYFIVNHRFMRHPYFAKAVLTAYERLIPEGFQPSFFLQFEVEPATIDVNIHPTKTEIKFQDESTIWQILLAAIREALGRFGATPAIDFDTENKPDIPVFQPSGGRNIAPPSITIDRNYNPFYDDGGKKRGNDANLKNWQELYKDAVLHNDEQAGNVGNAETDLNSEQLPFDNTSHPNNTYGESSDDAYLQLAGRYIVTTISTGLLVVDQHKAHVNVLYHHYQQALAQKCGHAQGLLFPYELYLEPSQIIVWNQIKDSLKYLGFDIEENNQNGDSAGLELIIKGLPEETQGLDPIQLIQNLLETASFLEERGDQALSETLHHTLALTLAQKSAIPVGQVLNRMEIDNLMQQLFALPMPNILPDGTKTLQVVPNETIDQLFQG